YYTPCQSGLLRCAITTESTVEANGAKLTTSANDIVRPIHPQRMRVILHPCDYEVWLDGSAAEAFELLKPYASDEMDIVKSGAGEKSDTSL
ncbi:SOS response-associated peptidase family protein, partial [Ruegeria faecimaris]|uniref:SOS response-associated peptidase family protein n=1 Tax=Ruegeria faecimaris TaxID=686389 RepID=UPI00232D1B86